MTAHLAALALIATQALAGHALLERLGWAKRLHWVEQLGFGWAAGFTLSSGALLLAAAAGGLGTTAAGFVFVVLLASSWPSARALARKAVARPHARARRSALAWVAAALALAWAWPLVTQTLLPNSDWDSALYQLPLAERYLAGELWGRDPYFPAYAFPGSVNLLYAALLSFGLEAAIVPMNFYIALSTLALTGSLAFRLGGGASAGFAALALASVPLFWQLGVDPRVDGFLCLCVTLAFYGLYLHVCRRDEASFLLTAVALGAALGCKYTAVFFGGGISALAIAFLVSTRTRSEALRGARLARVIGLYVTLLCLPNASWYAANFAIHGDPLFPMIRGFYVSTDEGEREYLPSEREPQREAWLDVPVPTSGLADSSRSTDPTSEEASAPPTHLFDLWNLLVAPEEYAVKPNHGVGPFPFLSLLLPVMLALGLRKPGVVSGTLDPRARVAMLVLWLAAWGSYALLGSQTNLLRYVLPTLPAMSACAGFAIARVPVRSVRAAVGFLGALLLFSSHVAEMGRLDVLRAREALALPADGLAGWDRDPRVRWLERVGYNFTPAMALATRQINGFIRTGRMQHDDLVLMVGEGKGRLLDCRYLPDGSWFLHRFAAELANAGNDVDVLASRLREQGVTHVLYNRGYFEDWVLSNTRTDPARIARAQAELERLLADRGRTILKAPGMELVELGASRSTRPDATEARP